MSEVILLCDKHKQTSRAIGIASCDICELEKKVAEIGKRLREEKIIKLAAIEESLEFQVKIIELELEVKRLRLWKR